MVKTTVYLQPELVLALRQRAASEGRSQADLIREALAVYLQRRGTPRPLGIGRYASGRSDVSARADEILARATKERRWR